MATEDERRREPRYAARIQVRFRSVDELVTAYTTDLSRGGLYVAASVQLAPGTVVQLAFELPDGGPAVRIPARVAYVLPHAEASARGRAPGMGMQFHTEEAEDLGRRIAEYLSSEPQTEVVPPRAEAPLHVLVVDDSPSHRAQVVLSLRSAGHRVTTAEHGLEALGKALKEPPDLVLTDVNMPVMDGWQLLRLLRARDATKDVPIAFLTSLTSEHDRIRGYEAGVDDYMEKPFAEEELVARVRRVVARAYAEPGRAERSSGLSGDLRHVSIASLLSFAEAERRSGLLTIHGPRGDARVGLQHGAVVSVDLPGGGGVLLERLLALLDWEDGRFELGEVELVASDQSVSVQQALLEHARRKDEGLA